MAQRQSKIEVQRPVLRWSLSHETLKKHTKGLSNVKGHGLEGMMGRMQTELQRAWMDKVRDDNKRKREQKRELEQMADK